MIVFLIEEKKQKQPNEKELGEGSTISTDGLTGDSTALRGANP